MNAREVFDLIRDWNLKGNLMPRHPTYDALLLPDKFILRIPGVNDQEIEYDGNFNPVIYRAVGVEERYNGNSLIQGQLLFRDPRYCLLNALTFAEIRHNFFVMTVWDTYDPVLFGKMSVDIELEIGNVKITMTRRKFVHGNKESLSQRETIAYV